jgi:hypothetical protein
VQLRIARHTDRLDEVVEFYRDGIGLTEIGRFRDHDGYDGVFLAVPGTGAHLELTAGGGHGAPAPPYCCAALCGSSTPTLEKTYMTKPEQSKPAGDAPPQR